jgi:hypothetical protein
MAFHRSTASQQTGHEGELALLVQLKQAEIPKLAKDTYVNSRKARCNGRTHYSQLISLPEKPTIRNRKVRKDRFKLLERRPQACCKFVISEMSKRDRGNVSLNRNEEKGSSFSKAPKLS